MKIKVISVILILLLSVILLQNNIYATVSTAPVADSSQAGGSSFDWNGKKTEMMTKDGDNAVIDPINKIAGTAITVTQVISVGVAIIMLIVLAIKYMSSAPGDKATIKNHAVVYVVGAIVMFACTGILGIIKQFASVIS